MSDMYDTVKRWPQYVQNYESVSHFFLSCQRIFLVLYDHHYRRRQHDTYGTAVQLRYSRARSPPGNRQCERIEMADRKRLMERNRRLRKRSPRDGAWGHGPCTLQDIFVLIIAHVVLLLRVHYVRERAPRFVTAG